MSYTRITYKPEGARRSRTVTLTNVRHATFADADHIIGVEVDEEGNSWFGGPTQSVQRTHVITCSLISSEVPMKVDRKYGVLRPVGGAR